MFGGQSGFNFEVPPESFIAEEDIVPDDDEEDPDYCEPMIVSVQLSDRDQLKVCPRASATPRMPVGIEDRSMGDRSLEPMIVAIELGNRNILPQSQDSKSVNANNTSCEDARIRKGTQSLAEPVSVIKATGLEANVHSVNVPESQPPPPAPAAEVQAVAVRRKRADSATKQDISAPASEIGGDAPLPADGSNVTPKTAEVSNDAMETADVSNEIAEVSSEVPETAEVSSETPETANVCDDIQKAAEVSSDVPVTAEVSSGDGSKNADVGVNGDRDVEGMEQRMDDVSLEEAEPQQQEPTLTQTEQEIQQLGDAGDIREAHVHKAIGHMEREAPPTTTPPTTEDMTTEPQETTCTEGATPLINAGDENRKSEQESTPPEQEEQLPEGMASGEEALQLEEIEGEKMEDDTPQGIEPVANDVATSAVAKSPEDKVGMNVEEKPEHRIEEEDVAEHLSPEEDICHAESKFMEESASDKIEPEEQDIPAKQAEDESVPPQVPSDEIGSEDASVSQTESKSEGNFEIRLEKQTADAFSRAEEESVPGPSDDVKPEEEPTTTSVAHAAQSETEPRDDEVVSEEQTAADTGGEVKAGTSVSESREMEQEEMGEMTAAVEAKPEKQPLLSTQTDTLAVDEEETEDRDVDQPEASTAIDPQGSVVEKEEEREWEEEEREFADSAVAGSMGEESEWMSESKSTPASEELPPPTTSLPPISRAEENSEVSKPKIQTEEGDDRMDIEATQECESEAPPTPLSSEIKSSPSPPPPPTPPDKASSNIPAIVVSMESAVAATTGGGDEAESDGDNVVEPASRERDTPVVEKGQEEEETISHQAEVDVPAAEQPQVDAVGQGLQELEQEEMVAGSDKSEIHVHVPDLKPRIETSYMELSESAFEIEQASVIVEPPSSIRDDLESEPMLSEDFDDDMDVVDSEHDQEEEEATAVDEDAPIVSSDLIQEEGIGGGGGGQVGIDGSSPVASSEPSCEEETTVASSESSQEETAVPDELAPIISTHPVQEEGEAGIEDSAPAISSEPSCAEEAAVERPEPSEEDRETLGEVAPLISEKIVHETIAGDDGAPGLTSEPMLEGEDEAKIVSEDAPVVIPGPTDESEGAAVNEHKEGVAPAISLEPVDKEQGAAEVELTGEENIAESASQPGPLSTEPFIEPDKEQDKLVEQGEKLDKLVKQEEETSGGEKEERQSPTADFDRLTKPGDETGLTSGVAEMEEGQPSLATAPNSDELAKPVEESSLTDAVAEQEKEGEKEQLMELPPDPDRQAKPDLEGGQTTSDVGSSGEKEAARGGEGREEREEGEGEVSRESGGLQLESGPIEVDVLLHAEEDDLSVFSAEAAEADKALTLSSSSRSRKKPPQTSSSASTSASSSSRQRRLSKSSSSPLVGSLSLGEASSTGPGASSAVSSTASGTSRRVSVSGPEAAVSSGGGGEKRPRLEKSEVRETEFSVFVLKMFTATYTCACMSTAYTVLFCDLYEEFL